MIDLEPKYLQEVLRILDQHVPGVEVRAFGSRVTGRARKYSDLDLALVANDKLDWRRVESLKDAFSQSDLPFIVDVLDFKAISESFRNVVDTRYEILRELN
jgi:predicted nucleotidyltransferase